MRSISMGRVMCLQTWLYSTLSGEKRHPCRRQGIVERSEVLYNEFVNILRGAPMEASVWRIK
jgi:hypothetical protein